MNPYRVVIEYVFNGNAEADTPDMFEALTVQAKVVGNVGGPLTINGLRPLAEIRDGLEEAGFEIEGIKPTKPRTYRRWEPTWREVWTREAPPSTYGDYAGDLSPRASKTRRESAARARGYFPRLARTTDKVLVMRPLDGGRTFQKRFAHHVAEVLPGFKFNSKSNWWEAPLGELATARAVLGNRVNLSDGARDYLEVTQ